MASGVAAAQRALGRKGVRVIAQGGDGGTTDIGFGCLSGMFERNDDVLYICYDNEAYMNTVQRSSAPPAARTATTPAVVLAPGNVFGTGKNVPRIAMAHRIPYVATAMSNLRDLEAKVTYAMTVEGARYVHILALPAGWGTAPEDTIKIARLAVESGLFPLFEAHHGGSRRGLHPGQVPVTEYLKPEALRAPSARRPTRKELRGKRWDATRQCAARLNARPPRSLHSLPTGRPVNAGGPSEPTAMVRRSRSH